MSLSQLGYRADSLGTASVPILGDVTFPPKSREAVRQSGNTLLKWLEEFQPKKSHFASGILAEDSSGNGRRFAGDNSRGGRGRGGNGEMDELLGAQNVARGHASTCCADVESFCELDKLCPGGVSRAEEDGHLQTNAGRPS